MNNKGAMDKDQALQYLTNAMSLRPPQEVSLRLFADYLTSPAGSNVLARLKRGGRGSLTNVEAAAKDYASSIPELARFQGFERSFPSYTFALATGVGKTRLMGAFVAYLYLVYDIRHFMIVAPGNTIYRKLMDDFSKAGNPKYVFRGIAEINTNSTRIIGKDNYPQNDATAEMFGNQIQINIFNVQQFAQKEIEQEKGITKFSETLGESYFEYLSSLDDLVVLMDESHHYHADAAMGSLDRVDPFLGLEFTATPYTGNTVGRGKQRALELKKNIFYTYNLGDAIRDGFVKDPWVGTEADVDFSQWDANSIETDARKLQLAAYFHDRAKAALKKYALENNKPEVKPVMLVVAKDTTHASALFALIDSDDFRGGAFKGKVIAVHTKIRGDEADETIEKLLSLEHPDNVVEIVIHVNMLKEGWDVNNIYTIAPIRSSASEILTEQTIGRGLRLPYGERTGEKNVDRVMIVAHDNYAKVVEEARHSTLIQPSNIEAISSQDAATAREVIEVPSAFVSSMQEQIRKNDTIMQEIKERAAKAVSSLITEDTPEDVKVATIDNKANQIVQVLAKHEASRISFGDLQLLGKEAPPREPLPFAEGTLFAGFSETAKKELDTLARTTGQTIELHNIPIPRLMLTPHYGELLLHDFNLDTKRLSRYATEASIIEERLQANEERDLFGNVQQGSRETEFTRVSSLGEGRSQSPESTIISGLLDFPLVDYEEQKTLLLKLANQATTFYRTFAKEDKSLKMVVENNFRQIASEIYQQVLEHKEYKSDGYLESEVREPKSYLEAYNISRAIGEQPVTLESQRDRFPREKLYSGFKKACHSMYRFDSSDEARLAYLLDRDPDVEDWLRPAPNQFEGLYWRDEEGNSQHRYEPDFVVECADEILMVEVKERTKLNEVDVQEKKKTAEKYCELVSKNVGKYGIAKPWRYVLLPTDKITVSATVKRLLAE